MAPLTPHPPPGVTGPCAGRDVWENVVVCSGAGRTLHVKPSFGTPRLSNAANAWQQLHHLDDRERQDRLAADRNLPGALQRANFTGPDWTFVERVLAEYGVAVIASWIRKGTIASKCAEKERTVP